MTDLGVSLILAICIVFVGQLSSVISIRRHLSFGKSIVTCRENHKAAGTLVGDTLIIGGTNNHTPKSLDFQFYNLN